MAETEFARFRETNDHEGESWTFWLQATGNDEELAKLSALLNDESDDDYDGFPYVLDLDVREPEAVVDKLVEHADEGYMASHNKGSWTADLPGHPGGVRGGSLQGRRPRLLQGRLMRALAATLALLGVAARAEQALTQKEVGSS